MAVTTVEEFAERAARTPKAIVAALPRSVTEAATETVKTQRLLLRAATGDGRLSGVGRNGSALTVGVDIQGRAVAKAIIQAEGPWQLIEEDVRPHRVPKSRSRRGRKRYAVVGGHPYDHANNAGGSRGKHPFMRGWKQSQPKAREAFADEQLRAIAKSIGAKRT